MVYTILTKTKSTGGLRQMQNKIINDESTAKSAYEEEFVIGISIDDASDAMFDFDFISMQLETAIDNYIINGI
jgi:hypothetical protein